MPSITIKNIPDKIYKKLKTKAERNKRSLNNEILNCLESSVENRRVNVEGLIKRARMLRVGVNFVIKNEEINRLKQNGRL